MPRFLRNALLPVLALLLSGCGYNAMQAGDEQVKAAWSEVLNQYQRRADLVPNLVSTVKGYASHEASVLTQVTEARAKVGSVQLNADQLDDEQAVQRFQKAQGELSSASPPRRKSISATRNRRSKPCAGCYWAPGCCSPAWSPGPMCHRYPR